MVNHNELVENVGITVNVVYSLPAAGSRSNVK